MLEPLNIFSLCAYKVDDVCQQNNVIQERVSAFKEVVTWCKRGGPKVEKPCGSSVRYN